MANWLHLYSSRVHERARRRRVMKLIFVMDTRVDQPSYPVATKAVRQYHTLQERCDRRYRSYGKWVIGGKHG